MGRDPYRASTGELSRRDYERDSHYEEDESYTRGGPRSRSPPPPVRPRDRSPIMRIPPAGRGRTFEDDRVVHERRRYVDDDGGYMPVPDRMRRRPPPVIEDEREGARLPPGPRPGRLLRRQSSLDTFDRQPPRRFYDHVEETYERAPVRVEDIRRRPAERPVEQREVTRRFDELRIDERYRGKERSRERRSSMSSASSLSSGPSRSARSEYPKKGKTRMPGRLVSERALSDLGYPFVREGNTLVVQLALGQQNIDEVLRLSQDYKRSDADMVESKTTKTKVTTTTYGGSSEERHHEDVYMTSAAYPPQPAVYSPPPVAYSPPPMAPPAPIAYAPPPGPPPNYVVPAPQPPPPPPPQQTEYTTTTVQIRDESPPRTYMAASPPVAMTQTMVPAMAPAPAMMTVEPAGPRPVIIDAAPPTDYSAAYGDLSVGAGAMVAVEHRHRRHRSHSRGDLYANIHEGYEGYETGHYYPRGSDRELVRTERLSTGELVVYEDEVERIEEVRRGVRIEKDKKGPPRALVRAMLATLT